MSFFGVVVFDCHEKMEVEEVFCFLQGIEPMEYGCWRKI